MRLVGENATGVGLRRQHHIKRHKYRALDDIRGRTSRGTLISPKQFARSMGLQYANALCTRHDSAPI